MSFWLGAMSGLTDYRKEEADKNYKAQLDKQAGEEKIALTLLESDDPEVQQAGLSILQAAMRPPKSKKGIRGSMGEYQDTAGLQPILAIANAFRGMTEGGGVLAAPPQQGSAALPSASPVEPKAQGPGAVQPPMMGGGGPGDQGPPAPSPLQMALGGSEDMSAMIPDLPNFGGIPLSPPQAAAMDLSATPNGAFNMGQVAARVSRDKGQPMPGERQRLFWPTKASQAGRVAAAQQESEMMARAGVLQRLGASPQQLLQAELSRQGFSQGGASTSGEIEMQLPDGQKVLAYHFRDPRTGQAFLAYTGPSGQPTPLPPGAQPYRLPTAGAAGAKVTTSADGAQIIAQFPEWQGRVDPAQRYRYIVQNGQITEIGPQEERIYPPMFTSAGIDPSTGMPYQRDRNGNVVPTPGMGAPTFNARVAAAAALTKAVQSNPQVQKIAPFDPSFLDRTFTQLAGQYPALAGLSPAEIRAIASMPETAPDTEVERVLQQIRASSPAATPKPQGMTAPPVGPMQVPPPPAGATATPPAAAAPAGASGAPPAGWAQAVVDEILKSGGKPPTGTVRGRGVPKQ